MSVTNSELILRLQASSLPSSVTTLDVTGYEDEPFFKAWIMLASAGFFISQSLDSEIKDLPIEYEAIAPTVIQYKINVYCQPFLEVASPVPSWEYDTPNGCLAGTIDLTTQPESITSLFVDCPWLLTLDVPILQFLKDSAIVCVEYLGEGSPFKIKMDNKKYTFKYSIEIDVSMSAPFAPTYANLL